MTRQGARRMPSYDDILTRRQIVRSVVSSTIGTTIEWYDTVLYSMVVGIYLGVLFFPSHNVLASALAGYSTLFISYLSRPIGAAVFGHFGDRTGRKATLIATLGMTGICSVLIGFLPTYAQVGPTAPILLLVLRIGVGMALGGEWGGAILLPLEWGNRSRRGLLTSLPMLGLPAAALLSTLALQASVHLVGPRSYWAWRLPFIVAVVIVGVGLYVRLGLLETPTFSQLLERRRVERAPLPALFRHQSREVILACFARVVEQTPGFVFGSFILFYAVSILHFSEGQVLAWVAIGSALSLPAVVLSGALSDVIGRKWMYAIGIVLVFAFSPIYFRMLDTRVPALVFAAIAIALPLSHLLRGPLAALVAESFTGRLRYSGGSVGSGLSAILSGPAGAISVALLQRYHSSTPIAFYLMLTAVVSFAATLVMPERSRQDLTREYDEPAEPLAQPGVL